MRRRNRPFLLSRAQAAAIASDTRRGSNSETGGYAAKVPADDPEYPERVAIPTMQAIDAMPSEYRALVHEFGYVDVYRAWRRGWSVEQIAGAVSDMGVFELPTP